MRWTSELTDFWIHTVRLQTSANVCKPASYDMWETLKTYIIAQLIAGVTNIFSMCPVVITVPDEDYETYVDSGADS